MSNGENGAGFVAGTVEDIGEVKIPAGLTSKDTLSLITQSVFRLCNIQYISIFNPGLGSWKVS